MGVSRKPTDRLFFGAAGVWFLALTFVGFAPSFYLRENPEPLPPHQILHGIVYSAWILMFLAQVALVSINRTRWHMALGSASVVLLVVMIPIGFHVVLVKTAAGLKSIDVAGFNLTELTLGFGLAFAGLATRKRPFVHKRLMLFATLMLTVAAADRVAAVIGLEEIRLVRKILAATPGVAVVGYDGLVLRKTPFLSAALLLLVWGVLWFVVSDFLFLRPAGEVVIRALVRVFVW